MEAIRQVKLNVVEWVVVVLVAIGAINWGLIGIGGLLGANFNVINLLIGRFPLTESFVYLLVGIAGVYFVYFAARLWEARTGELTEPAKKRAIK